MGQTQQKGLDELREPPTSGIIDVFDDITCALQSLQVQQQQIMNQDLKESEHSLCFLNQILDLHVQHMEELLTRGKALTGQSQCLTG